MALKDCNKAIALKPDYAVAYNNRACVYLHLGENGLAEHDLSQAIKLDPEYISAYTNRSALYNATGRYEMAIQDATRVIQTQPQNHVAFNNRGFAHYGLNEFDAAEHDIQEAIRLKPDYPKPYYILGLISEDRGDAEDATRLFRKALDLTNDPDLRQRIENELQFIEGS
jgi:tetratricopeptide (TPR) repeat protein